jgi:hypothetical protein
VGFKFDVSENSASVIHSDAIVNVGYVRSFPH